MTGPHGPDDDGIIHPLPGEDRWRVITPAQAVNEFSGVVVRKSGISVSFSHGPPSNRGLWLSCEG